MDLIAERGLPHHLEAETCVLGSIIWKNSEAYQVIEKLSDSDFYAENNAIIYRMLVAMITESIAVDFITLKERLTRSGELEKVGGITYISKLCDEVPEPGNILHYADIVKEKAKLRNLIRTGYELIDRSYKAEESADKITEYGEMALSSITKQSTETTITFEQAATEQVSLFREAQNNETRIPGIPTSLRDLDDIITGLRREELCYVAGRPGEGKTAFACTVVDNTSEQFKSVFFSLEQSRSQIFNRMIAKSKRIDLFSLGNGKINSMAWKEAYQHAMQLGTRQCWIDDSGSTSLNKIRAVCRRLKITSGLDFVIIDYLGLLRHTMPRGMRYQRYEVVAEISHGLKALARDLKIAVMCLCQLNRDLEKYKQPELHNLRESGDLEQDADTVLFLWTKLDKRTNGTDGKAKEQSTITVAKQRNGPIGSVAVNFEKKYTSFTDLSKYDEEHYEPTRF
jgi:replicative DNA helicase